MIIEKSKIGAAIDWSEFHLWSYRFTDARSRVKRSRSYSESDIDVKLIPSTTETPSRFANLFSKRNRRFSENDAQNYDFSKTTSHSNSNPLINLFAGALAGGVANYSTHWLDTIKVQMQCQPQLYSNSIDCLCSTWRAKGIHGLYRGACPAVFGHTSKTGIAFMSYGMCANLVCKLCDISSPDDLMLLHHASIGAFTGILASLFLCPLEVVKCRLQVDSHSSSAPYHIIKNVYGRDGVKGFYRGLSCIWMKEIPGSFIYFGSYECAKNVNRIYFGDDLNSKSTFMCGCWAGFCFCITHPIETVKSRVQVANGVGKQYSGFFKTAADIIKNEGICLLCSGIKPCIVRAIIISGIQFTVFEYTKKKFAERGSA